MECMGEIWSAWERYGVRGRDMEGGRKEFKGSLDS